MDRYVGLPAWEGAAPWMCQDGLSVERERCGVSVYFTQTCSISPLLQEQKVVGQNSGDFCLNPDTSPHMWGVGMDSGAGGPTAGARRIMAVVDELQGLSETAELPWWTNSHSGPCQSHHQQTVQSQAGWEEKVVTNPEQLSEDRGQRMWGKKVPPEGLIWMWVSVCPSHRVRGVSKWSKHRWVSFTKNVCKQASMVASVKSRQVTYEQILCSQSIWSGTTQFLYPTVLMLREYCCVENS